MREDAKARNCFPEDGVHEDGKTRNEFADILTLSPAVAPRFHIFFVALRSVSGKEEREKDK